MGQAKKAAINYYKDGPKGWAARGKTLHSVLEKTLLGEPITRYKEWEEWIDPLVECELFQGAKTLAVEYPICDPIRSVGGSFDFLIQTQKGEIVLGDLKTCSTKNAAKRRKPANEQLGAYLVMLNRHHPRVWIDKCCTVISGPKICLFKEEDPDKCAQLWRDTWEKYEITLEGW